MSAGARGMSPLSYDAAPVVDGGWVFGSVAHNEASVSPRLLPLVQCVPWLHRASPSDLDMCRAIRCEILALRIRSPLQESCDAFTSETEKKREPGLPVAQRWKEDSIAPGEPIVLHRGTSQASLSLSSLWRNFGTSGSGRLRKTKVSERRMRMRQIPEGI